ncbi:MAG: hypothetical protein J6X61_00895, partial [Clostridia bacterium]|nr:hypothetical protein [Clostridia bacterium]
YAWRGDYPDPVTPEPDGCGFLHYDGRPTDSFERDAAMLKMVNAHSTELVTAERLSSGVAVLHSDRAVIHFDALTDPQIGGKNFRVRLAVETFRELKKNGVAPDIVRACDLEKNVLGVKVLFVPSREGMGKEEWAQLGAFAAKEGHRVFYGDQQATFGSISVGGWWDADSLPGNRSVDEFRGGYEIEDVLNKIGFRPLVETGHKNLFAHVLQGEKRKIVVLVTNAPDEAAIPAHVLRLNFPFTRATLRTPEQEVTLRVEGEQVFLPAITDGALLFVE